MEQVLFVLHDGKISQWNLSRGKLAAVTVRGQHKVPYSAETAKAYWDDWKEDNQVVKGEVYDAIFLSYAPNDFGALPKWICANSKDKSAWTIEQLSLLASEAEYKETGFCLVQGKVKRFIGTANEDTAMTLYLKSSLMFILPKEETKRHVAKIEPKNESQKVEKEAPVAADCGLTADCLASDEKAQKLKVGDTISGKIVKLSQVRNRCFIDSDSLSQQLRIFYKDLAEYCKATQRPIPSEGDVVSFKVQSVLQSELINLKLEVC